MSLSSRDMEEIEKKPFKEPWFTGIFIGIFRLIAKIPFIRRKLNNSIGGLSGNIFSCWEKQDYKKATEISIYALERFRCKKDRWFPDMMHHHWWSFVKHGVDSAKHIDVQELNEKLISLAKDGIEPFEGYDVAYSFLEFSRWEYARSNNAIAFKYAEIASKADETWGEPDFVLGWLSLVLGKGRAEYYLRKAISKDKRILFKISSNSICKQYPNIINKLKEMYAASSNKSEP